MTNQVPASASRCVLEGVPRIAFYEGGARCPEDICFPSALRASLEYLGENLGCRHIAARNMTTRLDCAYSYILGVSGSASFLSWKQGWQPDSADIRYMPGGLVEPLRRTFEAVGHAYEWVPKAEEPAGEALFRAKIMASIRDQGRPVLSFGVLAPPECGIITGYDEGGDVLIGWNFFQRFPEFNAGLEFEPSGYYRKRDWFKDTIGLVVIGDKVPTRPLAEIYHDALQWALEVTRIPQVVTVDATHANGLAAYSAWAEALSHDEAFEGQPDATLRERHMAHESAVGNVAEARWYGGQFLRDAVEHVHYNMTEDILKAAACYAAEHALMWKLWDLAGGNGNPDAYKNFAKPAVRREMIPIIQEARAKDIEAADHLERALAR